MFVLEGIELADKEEVSVHILMLTFLVNGQSTMKIMKSNPRGFLCAHLDYQDQ